MRLARTILWSVALGIGVASAAMAASMKGGPGRSETPTTRARPSRPLEFGVTDYVVTSVFTGGMAADDTSQVVKANGQGYRYFPGGTGQLIGSVNVPSGVVIDHIGLNTCDAAGGSFTVYLYDSTFGSAFTPIGTFASSANTC